MGDNYLPLPSITTCKFCVISSLFCQFSLTPRASTDATLKQVLDEFLLMKTVDPDIADSSSNSSDQQVSETSQQEEVEIADSFQCQYNILYLEW